MLFQEGLPALRFEEIAQLDVLQARAINKDDVINIVVIRPAALSQCLLLALQDVEK